MIIYGALLIPVIVAFILYKYYNHQTVWWEFFLPLGVSIIFTFSMKLIIETVQVSSDEYYGSFVKRVEYYEPWNEYIHRTCTRSCGKNCTTTYDCSYVSYHSAEYQIVTTTDEKVSITEAEYHKLKAFFNNDNFVELNRNYYTDDGDLYYSQWQGDKAKAVPVTTIHSYENRIKACDQSIFHFKPVEPADKLKYQLKEYPEIYDDYKMQTVLGDDSKDAQLADKKFAYINGLLGHKKEVRVFVLVFKNQPVEAAIYQEWYWSGGNMNEFVICVGIDNNRNVKWCKPISWTRSEILKSEVKNFVQSQDKLNLQAVADFTEKQVNAKFIRRDFEEFNYLTVEPPTWAVILTYVLTLAVNLGVSYWIIQNEHEDYDKKNHRKIWR